MNARPINKYLSKRTHIFFTSSGRGRETKKKLGLHPVPPYTPMYNIHMYTYICTLYTWAGVVCLAATIGRIVNIQTDRPLSAHFLIGPGKKLTPPKFVGVPPSIRMCSHLFLNKLFTTTERFLIVLGAKKNQPFFWRSRCQLQQVFGLPKTVLNTQCSKNAYQHTKEKPCETLKTISPSFNAFLMAAMRMI